MPIPRRTMTLSRNDLDREAGGGEDPKSTRGRGGDLLPVRPFLTSGASFLQTNICFISFYMSTKGTFLGLLLKLQVLIHFTGHKLQVRLAMRALQIKMGKY